MSCNEELLLRCPAMQHVAVVSGQDIPLRLISPMTIPQGATLYGDFRFGLGFDDSARTAALKVLREEMGMEEAAASAWGNALTFHHTWLVLSRYVSDAPASRAGLLSPCMHKCL